MPTIIKKSIFTPAHSNLNLFDRSLQGNLQSILFLLEKQAMFNITEVLDKKLITYVSILIKCHPSNFCTSPSEIKTYTLKINCLQ